MKYQRTGLSEGSLLYNNWLKKFNLYREDTEAEFINWLYSTSGWYDKDIRGSYFDIDVEAVKGSDNYRMFLEEYHEALKGSDLFHLMLHSSWHLNGLEKQAEFCKQYSETNRCYWNDVPFLQAIIKDKKVLVISSIAELISDKYRVFGFNTPQTHFNTGPHKNSWETLEWMFDKLPKNYDIALISCGSYGVLLADMLVNDGKDAITIGSGIYNLFPVGEIPEKYRPNGWEKIENGRYWLNK
jgi:5'(3')-deoxyribonucleotidase